MFELPKIEDKASQIDFAQRSREATGPAVELISGAPAWLGSKFGSFTFQRLSFLGLRQIETGERVGNVMLASQVILFDQVNIDKHYATMTPNHLFTPANKVHGKRAD